MTQLQANRIVNTFADLRSGGQKALLPFITAGYPDMETTEALLREFAARGVRVCELGIPYSDPVADGPVIQASYTEALAKGIRVHDIFEMVRHFRLSTTASKGVSKIENRKSEIENGVRPLAIIAMLSYAIVYRHGVEAFAHEAAAAGIDGLIIPDLPVDEAATMEKIASAAGLCNVMLIAPTTPAQRRYEIARHSRGFIYYISVAGITGERTALPEATIAAVAELRKHTETPVCVGFGISNAATVAEVCRAADGAIVGSAIVKRITQGRADGLAPEALVSHVGEFVGQLMAGLK